MATSQKKLKYEIIETIMKMVIYDKKRLRESFIQEIIKTAENA